MDSNGDELLEEIERQGCKVIGYGDNLMLIVGGPFLEILKEITQRNLKIVETWYAKASLSVNQRRLRL